MKASLSVFNFVSLVRRQVDKVSFDARTQAFLKERNVRVIVKKVDNDNFHAFALKPKTYIYAFGRELRLEIKILDSSTAWVTVYDMVERKPLIGVRIPYDDEAGTLNLDFKDVHLKMVVDAVPSRTK